MENISYEYSNLPIPGGGYVTGFLYHPGQKDILYCRTDIGGSYKFDFDRQKWISLIDHVTMENPAEVCVTGLAIDEHYPNRLYISCGISDFKTLGPGLLAVSEDYGNTFTYHELPCPVHGNWPGRGTGRHLMVDPANSDILYYAGQYDGLMRSVDRGLTWEKISISNDFIENEGNDTFIWINPLVKKDNRSQILVLGTSGIANLDKDSNIRGNSLYISFDAGSSWSVLDMPASRATDKSLLPGLVAQRFAFDGKYFYVTLAATGKKAFIKELAYSCDSGDACNGMIIRYPVKPDHTLGSYEDITPKSLTVFPDGIYDYGFSGISTVFSKPGLITATTICKKDGDIVYISKDYGSTWEMRLFDLHLNNLDFKTSYMKPEYNGGHSIIHWLSDICINPFNPDDVIFNTGTGVFGTYNFTADNCRWSDRCDGIEETVHLNVYSPHKGRVLALDIVGDLGGFAFTDLNSQCRNSFDDEHGNRYITCINADYSDLTPEYSIITPRGNWTGHTTGGLIISKDDCRTFTHLPLPFGIDDYIDTLLTTISHPNNNSGWVALSPDCHNIVWSIADRRKLPIEAVVYSNDSGRTFARSAFYNTDQKPVTGINVKVFSDRCKSDIIYAFSDTHTIFISKDGGRNFVQCGFDQSLPIHPLWNIDTEDITAVVSEHGKSGIFYLSLIDNGLWKIRIDASSNMIFSQKMTSDGITVYKMGLGIKEGEDFLTGEQAIYLVASIDSVYGFYLSTDSCRTYKRINNSSQMYGIINCICGDSRVPGRFFIATGSRGLLYGIPADQKGEQQ